LPVCACLCRLHGRQVRTRTGKNGFGVSSVERSIEPSNAQSNRYFFSHALILNENPHKSTESFITAK